MVRSSCGLLLVLRDYSVQISGIDGARAWFVSSADRFVSACLIVLSFRLGSFAMLCLRSGVSSLDMPLQFGLDCICA